MRAFNYLLFRIYCFYTDIIKENDKPLFYTATLSTVVIGINILTIAAILAYFEVLEMFSNKNEVILVMILLWLFIYYVIIQKKCFLEYNFKKSKRGGVLVMLYILITLILFLIVAFYNRDKISEEKKLQPKSQYEERKPSLENDIRKWFKEL